MSLTSRVIVPLFIIFAAAFAVGHESTVVYQINAGGAATAEGGGWDVDGPYTNIVASGSKTTTTSSVIDMSHPSVPVGTPTSVLKTERWDSPTGAEMQWTFPVEPGEYQVSLLFAETWTKGFYVGARVFDVSIEGNLVLPNYDIFAEVGGNKAIAKTFTFQITDGAINIDFQRVVQNPAVKAIQILHIQEDEHHEPPAPEFEPILVNAGGPAIAASEAWLLDDGTFSNVAASGSKVYTTTNLINLSHPSVPAGTPASIFQTERWDPVAGAKMIWSFPVPPGTYEVSLYFAEIYPGTSTVGARVFNVFLEGTMVLNNLDIFAEVGANKGLVKTFLVESDDILNVEFAHIANNPAIKGLRIAQVSSHVPLFSNHQDIGPVAIPGSYLEGNHAAVITASGADIWGVSDQFHFAYGEEAGNLEIVAKVESIQNSHIWAKGGIMFRNSLAPGSRNAFIAVTPGNGVTFQRRLADGNISVSTKTPAVAPEYIKLSKVGNTIQGFHSENGTTWSPVGPAVEIAFDSHFFAGLAVTSHTNAALTEVSFSEVAITRETSPPHDDTYLHVVIDAPPIQFDQNGSGSEVVPLKGGGSHTHEFGYEIASYAWEFGGAIVSTNVNADINIPVGSHWVKLTITDNKVPAESLSDSLLVTVSPANAIPGLLVKAYPSANPGNLLTGPLPAATGAFQIDQSQLNAATGFQEGYLMQMTGTFQVTQAASHTFTALGGSGNQSIFINGNLVTGPVNLAVGSHTLETRFAVSAATQWPLSVTMSNGSGNPAFLTAPGVWHDLSNMPPILTYLTPDVGNFTGGNEITLTGVGFFPTTGLNVNWGGQTISTAQMQEVTPTSLIFIAPPGTNGPVTVTVNTAKGASNSRTFTYSGMGPLPIQFAFSTLTGSPNSPTTGTWGPDGRLYFGTRQGVIHAFTLNDQYQVVSEQVIAPIKSLPNPEILGIAFSPFDPPSELKIYVAHSKLFADGGFCLTGQPVPYSGQVSRLTGPDFNVVEPLVTNLPVSNHDHGINGMEFDNQGNLLITVGGNTNAGPVHCKMGELPEPPLSAAIVKAPIYKPGFNGNIVYVEKATGLVNMDQADGDLVTVAEGVDVSVFSSGHRNSYDLALTITGKLYTTDNGPNSTFGTAYIGPNLESTNGVGHVDELNLIYEGSYHGHPNPVRAADDPRQWYYKNLTDPSIPGQFDQALVSFPSSVNGLVEYRAQTLNGAMRGHLLAQRYTGNKETYRIVLNEAGDQVTALSTLGNMNSLDVSTGPGGVIFGFNYSGKNVQIAKPLESVTGTRVYDIFPWRAVTNHQAHFEIGGEEFGTLANTVVTIGGLDAEILSVTPTRIKGKLPIAPSYLAGELLNVTVMTNGITAYLPKAFLYLSESIVQTAEWSLGPNLPVPLGENAAGIIGNKLYVVGQVDAATQVYDLDAQAWLPPQMSRPYPGHHHPSEVYQNKLYLFGGLASGSGGQVQIFDPITNSWSLGQPMPWSGGSSITALLGAKALVCGGIVGNATTNLCAMYDFPTNSWQMKASMPAGRNHAAAETDGEKVYVFGGRGPGSGDGNSVANGFANVQVYDIAANSWENSDDAGSNLAPLPQARGGMGTAVYTEGEFYVIGGETSTGAGATADKTYDRVDIYNPVTNTWRLGPALPVAVHGSYPVLEGQKIFMPGGGIKAGFSQSTHLQILTLP